MLVRLGAALFVVVVNAGCVVIAWDPWDACPFGPRDSGRCRGDPDGTADDDGDGLSDAEEEQLGLDPEARDSDDDGDDDGTEVDCSSDPLDPNIRCGEFADGDGDGLGNADEDDRGTDPENPDSDGDGDGDNDEIVCGSSPLDASLSCDDPAPASGGRVCWSIGDILARGAICTLSASNVFVQDMPSSGCIDAIDGTVNIWCRDRASGDDVCSCETEGGEDVVVDESSCPS